MGAPHRLSRGGQRLQVARMTWFAVKGTEVSLKSWRLLQQWICVLATGKGELGERCVSDEDGLALRLAKRATRSDRSTLTFRSMPLTCHYGRHPRAPQAARGRETRREPSTNPMSSNSSQADSAGSNPVTRSTREERYADVP